jgi:sugar phosphate permease
LAHGGHSLLWFSVFYGLDWIATVPPTVRLTADAFGRQNTGVIYGWIGASHQLGASLAAFAAGTVRTSLGDYRTAFWTAGALCFFTGFAFLLGRQALATKSVLPEPSLAASV